MTTTSRIAFSHAARDVYRAISALDASAPFEPRLRELVRVFKERAKYSSDWAKRANAAETRWKRFVDEGRRLGLTLDEIIDLIKKETS